MELLEYLIQLRGGAAAAAQVKGLSGEFNSLAASERRAAIAGKEAAAGTARMEASMAMLRKTAKVAGAALLATGFEAVKMSANFNHEMLRIRTDAGASTQELTTMKKGVLDLAQSGASMGQGPQSLAQGLYHLESLGIRGKDALKALTLASQESAISGANLEQTTSALGAAMYTGIKGTGDLTHLMGILNATVGAGNMRFQDLVDALGTGILPAAKVAGLGIQDVSAALAVLTDSGMAASSGGAQLATALHFLYAPSSKAATALASIGLAHNQLAVDMHKPQGLLVALTDLKTHLSGLSDVAKAQALNAILPGGRGRVLLTELTMLDRLKGKYDQINRTAGGFGGSVAMQRKDPLTQLKTNEAALQASMIRLGNVLLPVLVPALNAIAKAAAKIVGAFKDVVGWFQHGGTAARIIGKALLILGGTIVTVFAVDRVVRFGQAFLDAATNIKGAAGTAITWIKRIGGASTAAATETSVANGTAAGSFGSLASKVGLAGLRVAGLVGGLVTLQIELGKLTGQVAAGAPGTAGPNNPNGRLSNMNIGSGGGGSGQGGVDIFGVHVGLPFGLGATGAVVNRATLAMIGEAGPEAVVPLSRMPGAQPLRQLQPMSGGMVIHANFTHPIVIDGREVARANRREVIKAMAAGA